MTKRILLIDDQETVREAVIRHFCPPATAEDKLAALMGSAPASPAAPQYAITEARGGEEGVDILRHSSSSQDPFAVAIVDMRMPGINGIETIRRIRQFNTGIPIIVYSGWVDFTMPELEQANGSGAVEIVAKPHLRELRDAVERATRVAAVIPSYQGKDI